jgi:tetratricopeptide (TPR) repeat protein
MKRALLLLTALALGVAALVLRGPCAAEETFPPTLLGAGEEAAHAIEALRPAAETDLNAALRLAWLLHVYANDNAGAKALFERVVAADPGNVWARFGLASIGTIEGNMRAAFEQMRAVVEHHPEHPLAEIALWDWTGLWGQVPEARQGVGPILTALLDEPDVTSPETRRLALGLLRRDLEWHGQMDESRALLEATGAVRSWRFAGPFGPLQDLMFYARLAPEADAVLATSYTNEGKPLPTRRYDAREPDIEPPWLGRGVCYAETFVRPRAPGRAIVSVSLSGPVRVELNGAPVYFKDTLRAFAPETETCETTLPAGWSRLRLKFQSGSGLVVRLLDERGRPLAVEVDPTPRRVTQAPAAPGRLVPTACEAYLGTLAEGDPDNPLVLALVAQLDELRGDREAAKAAALHGVEGHDAWAGGQLVAADVLGADTTQPERIARSQAKAHYERALQLAGTCPVALYALARYEQQERRFKEAIEKLEQCVAQAPETALWQRALYDIYADRDWPKERAEALNTIARLNPDSPETVALVRSDAGGRNLFEAESEAALRQHRGVEGSSILAEQLWRHGKLDEAIAEYERLAAAEPDVTWYTRRLAALCEEAGRFERAARLLRGLLADEPRDTGLLHDLASVELQLGRGSEVVRLWRQILAEEPTDQTVRRALALHGMAEVFDDYAIDVAPYLADASLRERYVNYAAVLVVDYAIEQVFADGAARQYTHQLVLVNTKAGIEQWGEPDVPPGAELLELRVIKPDGTIIEPELIGGKGDISLTGLSEGDFIELEYIEPLQTYDDEAPAFLGPRFVFCSDSEPMDLTRYILMAPVSLELTIERANMGVKAKTWTRSGWRFWQWERHQVEPVRDEPLAVGMEEYMPWVRAGFGLRAGFEAAQNEDANIGTTRATLEVRRTVESLVKPGMDREAIVRTLHDWVNANIDGGATGPAMYQSASQTLGDRRGNRMALLKAMLEAAGIRSRVVMARPVTAFDSAVFPNSSDYGLLLVEDEAGRFDQWVDLNDKFYPLGFVHPAVQGGRAVVLRDVEGAEPSMALDLDAPREELRVPVWPETQVTQQVEADLHVDAAGDVEGTVATTYTSVAAAGLRGALERVDEDALARYLQQLANSDFRGAKLTDYAVEHRKDFDQPLVFRLSLSAPKYARVRGRNLRFNQPLFPLELRKAYLGVPERKTPMALFSPPSVRHRIVITLPAGTTLRQGLEPLALESAFGSYKYSFSFDEAAAQVVIEREFLLPIQRVQPEAYAAFAAFCRAIDVHEEEELRVILPEAAPEEAPPKETAPEEVTPEEPAPEEQPPAVEPPAEEEPAEVPAAVGE